MGGLVVGRAVLPASIGDTDPLEGQRTQRGLMGRSARTLLRVVGFGPVAVRNGKGGPFHEGLAQELGALQPPMDPRLVAAALGDRSNPRLALELAGTGVALALLAEGG